MISVYCARHISKRVNMLGSVATGGLLNGAITQTTPTAALPKLGRRFDGQRRRLLLELTKPTHLFFFLKDALLYGMLGLEMILVHLLTTEVCLHVALPQ